MSDTPESDLPPLDPELAAWFAAAPSPTMPPEVWDRIETALAAEPPFAPEAPAKPPLSDRPGGAAKPPLSDSNVIDLGEQRERRRSKVLPILAGAAGVVLVGAVVIPAMRAGNAPAPVTEAAPGGGASAALAVPGSATPDVANPRRAAMPHMMMSTGTDYASAAMPDQVGSLLATAGITDAAAVADMSEAEPPVAVETVGADGFTATAETLTDCLERLGMAAEDSPALVIDRATYDGADAAVIVAVKSLADPTAEPAVLDVVVVGSQCSEDDVAAAEHFEYAVAP